MVINSNPTEGAYHMTSVREQFDPSNIEPVHTLRHKNCPACAAMKQFALRKKKMGSLGLVEAGNIWLSSKQWKRRKPRTLEASQCYLNSLIRFFGDIPLKDIHAGSLLSYQTERSKVVGPSYLNHELNALSQILKQAGLWAALKDFYAPLPQPEWQKPKVFTQDEQQRIFDFAKDDPNLELAEIVFTITRNTSASGCELRLTRIRNLNSPSQPTVFRVTGDTTKNDIRPRDIPLTEDAQKAFRRALLRAAKLGSHRPEHFLFPLRVNRALWDPNRPASRSWLRKQTAILRERTGVEHLRPHAWRHQLCTEMLEQGKSPDTVRSIMGWVSEKMIETYSHTRMEAKLDALSALQKIGAKSETVQSPRLIQFPRGS